jgi:hypothetical protein
MLREKLDIGTSHFLGPFSGKEQRKMELTPTVFHVIVIVINDQP